MKNILALFFVAASIAIFFGYVDPTYQSIAALQSERGAYDQALSKSKELQALRDSLLSRYNTFSANDISRLGKLLPDGVDNVKLVLDVDNIASQYGLHIRSVSIDTEVQKDKQVISGSEGSVGSVVVSFTIPATYPVFVQFLKNLEQSLRLVDITSISFAVGSGDLIEYKVGLKTYWLR